MAERIHRSTASHPRVAIFLGAGASATDGAPLQPDLFRAYFEVEKGNPQSPDISAKLSRFFGNVFSTSDDATGAEYPTFEEVLGLLDLATLRGEALRELPLDVDEDLDIRSLRRDVVLAMAEAISGKAGKPDVHRNLVSNLRTQGLLDEILFVSVNYDILIDNAIETEAIAPDERGLGSIVNYGLNELTSRSDMKDRETRSFPLIKIHGSLNWLFCAVCSELTITYETEGVMRLVTQRETARCPRCGTLRTPVIVPPTYYKDLSNVYLSVVWNHASKYLRDTSHVIICGYSLPDADMHVKYLIKAAQLNRDVSEDPLQISLVNTVPGKSVLQSKDELARYERFFGAPNVTDARISFEDFAKDPASLVKAYF
jgi:NAD-dependent SIR2 family protein deacetylase